MNNWFQNYIAVMGAPPDETEEPTGAQLAALHKRTNLNDQAPYVDFAIWVPYGRRMSKVNKTRVYTPLGDGSYLYKDLPGPGSFQAWTSSWKVFKAACLMLNIANLAALEAYYRTIEKLVIQYPQCWGSKIFGFPEAMTGELCPSPAGSRTTRLVGPTSAPTNGVGILALTILRGKSKARLSGGGKSSWSALKKKGNRTNHCSFRFFFSAFRLHAVTCVSLHRDWIGM